MKHLKVKRLQSHGPRAELALRVLHRLQVEQRRGIRNEREGAPAEIPLKAHDGVVCNATLLLDRVPARLRPNPPSGIVRNWSLVTVIVMLTKKATPSFGGGRVRDQDESLAEVRT